VRGQVPAGIVDYFCIWVLLVDDADRADADVERLTQEALRNRKRSSMPMCGCCYGCGEPITGRLFHDADCRDEYERRQSSRGRNGRA